MLIQKKTTRLSRSSCDLRRTQSLRFFGYLIAACGLPALTLAADNPGAHEHGQARLQMAVEGSAIDLMFVSPAYNLAGFEHQARTDDEKKLLAEISHWLETVPLVNTDTGSCRVTSATVQLGGDTGAHARHDHHEKKYHEDEHQHEDKHQHQEHHHGGHHHKEKHGDHHKEEASHRDYEVAQQLVCDGITGSDTLTSALPERFPELEKLTVEWVGPAGQGSALITPSARRFTLDQ